MLGDEPHAVAAKGNRRMAIFVGSMAVGALGLWLPNGALWSFESQTAQAATNCSGGGGIAAALAAPTPCSSETALNSGNPNWQLAALTAVAPEEIPKRLNLRASFQSDDGFMPRLPKRERFAASVGALRTKPGEEPLALAAIEGPTPESALLDEIDHRDHALDLCGAGGGGLTSGDCDHPVDDNGGKDDDGGEHHDDGGEHAGGDDGGHHDDGGEGGEHGDGGHDEGGHDEAGHGGEGGEHANNDGGRDGDCNDGRGEGGGLEDHADGGDVQHDSGESGESGGDRGGHGGEGGEGGEHGGHGGHG